jgi:DNA-binding CsgD family transcriptional regulator/tetratricopeptide (TPR) repeat protein
MALGRLLQAARSGASEVLVLRGAPGIGKSALLAYAIESASGFRSVRASGVESEMELPFAGLHQLCAPLLDRLEYLPGPQRAALETAFGLADGVPPNRFLVGLAVLSLLSDAAGTQPLLCVIDDAQWLDHGTAQALSLAVRRLHADSVAVLFATRATYEPDELSGLPELPLAGLSDTAAMKLLKSAVQGRLDAGVAARIVAEARGNPLALLELPRAWKGRDLAGGFALPSMPLSGRIEESFRRRAEQLPPDARSLLLLAAAEPAGDPAVLWRAAARLGIGPEAAVPIEDDGMLEIDTLVRFRHPLVRSAVYKAAPARQRRQVHAALAEATDPQADPDRRAWHRAQATPGADDAVADDLERSAGRAQARGGRAAAAAFLERSAVLTLDPARKAERTLTAAETRYEAGAPDSALELLAFAEAEPLGELQRARGERLRARAAFDRDRRGEAVPLLLSAAKRLQSLDAALARDTYFEALKAANYLGGREVLLEVAEALPPAPPSGQPRALELLFTSWTRLITEGFPPGAGVLEQLKQAVNAFRHEPLSGEDEFRGIWFAGRIARLCWDDESWSELTARHVQLARDAGALSELPTGLCERASYQASAGDLAAAAATIDEAGAIAEVVGSATSFWLAPYVIATFGGENAAIDRVETAHREAVRARDETWIKNAEWARAVLYNGLGQYKLALTAAQRYCDHHPRGGAGEVLTELVEAAARCGEREVASQALQRLRERTQLAGTDWALGIQARAGALLSQGQSAEDLYQEAIERLGRCRMKLHLARAHLLYGEWLRREHRRIDARDQLGTAYEMLDAMRADTFLNRARTELLAAGGKAPEPALPGLAPLTRQEMRIAQLASQGLTNHQIAAQLFLSPNTVDYHLRKVFKKLNITRRGQIQTSATRVEDASLGIAFRRPR